MTEKYKEIIKSFTEENYKSGVNLHIHSTCSDGKTPPEDIIMQAHQNNYKYISITDHNTLNAYLKSDILKEEFLIPGIEFDSWYGTVFLHMLGYGIDVNNKELQGLCAKTKGGTEADWIRIFSFKHPAKLIKAIHNAGGIAVLAHPACCFTLNLDKLVKNLKKLGLDGIETYYPYTRHRKIIKFHKADCAVKLAAKYDLIKTGGTDEHGTLKN